MDDSDQDFVDLCSKLLKRVRKKPGEPRQPRKAEHHVSTQASDGAKRKRNHKRDGESASKFPGTQPVADTKQEVVCGGAGYDSGDAGRAERGLTAKDKVLQRMQQFKRASPQKLVHREKSLARNHENNREPLPSLVQGWDTPESFGSGLLLEAEDSDEALAVQLQQELDREAAQTQTTDLVDGGLFFCHFCYRDLTRMTAEGRTQHVNRCLDESEESASAPSHPTGVPDCPICGKKFKSQKSRSAHLKRCSSEMGVSPAVLLQALQRQAEETQNVPTANRLAETGGTKRKGSSKPGLEARKKPRKKTELLDEDTMVAMALSSSLLEQEKESERALQMEPAASHVSMAPVLNWRPHAGKGHGKKKKGAVPRPPPLLLVQDAEVALMRLQERVSALLLRTRIPSPPTPTRCPSSLPGWSGVAPLWQKSSLLDGASTHFSDFYTPELRGFITPWESTDAASSSNNKSESSVQPASEETFTESRASIRPSSSQIAASSPALSTSQTGQLTVGSQALRDLMELAEDGMTLTQCGYTASYSDKDKSAGLISNPHLSDFVQKESEEHADLCASGFLPETTHTHSDSTHGQTRRMIDRLKAETERGSQSVALSRLASDLSCMVNNPQLSDVQIQVDSGEVYFAHSFMVYTRCPLLAEMVHESGFGVQEDGMPAAQRVLISDVQGQAVFAFLHYLYTAHCSIPASLQPQVLELASRFDLKQLEQLCEVRQEDEASQGDEEGSMNQEENVNQTDQAFLELLRSMWNEEDEDNEATDTDGGQDEEKAVEQDHPADDLTACDREICEEKVNEEELEEIYEFAATQRKMEEEKDSMEKEEVEKVHDDKYAKEAFTKLTESETSTAGHSVKHTKTNSLIEPDPSLDRSYSCLFSNSCGTYEEEEPTALSSTSGQSEANTPQSQKTHSSHKSSSKLSDRALHQSSASIVSDLTLRSPYSTSNLPHSPGQVRGWRTDDDLDAPKEGLLLKRESQGPCSIYIALSPDSPQKKKEPELIVLSDSSTPSPHSPCAPQNLQSYTQIKPQPVQKPSKPSLEDIKSTSLELSPDLPSSPLDCSPEVSWLIPSTPLQHGRSTTSSTTSSSTQTRSSMCRTQLFPKGDTSSAPPSVFSSATLPFNNRLQASSSPVRVSAHVGPTEDGVPGVKVEETAPCSSSFDVNFCPKRINSCDMSEVREMLGVPLSQSEHSDPSSSISSKQDTPLHLQPQPCSSTPLHTELCQSPIRRVTSLLHSSFDKQRSSKGRERTPCDSPEKTDLGRFHLSPLPDPLDAPSSSSHTALQSPQRQSHSSRPSRRSFEFSAHGNAGKEPARIGMRDERACENKDTVNEGQQETGVKESSFRQSFLAMDEPPIAFNDSWGLDVCMDANSSCFSLRLKDSGQSSQQRLSAGQRETAGSSSSPSRYSVHFLNNPGRASASSSSKAQSLQARTSPSPPDPTTRTTPEISNSLLDSKIWDSWREEEEEALPLSQRVNPSAQLKTPALSQNKRRCTLVPITPMPHYSDMDTPELKNKLNRFGVRPLPKRQMILKLKEIHHYTHQLVSSDSEDEAHSAGRTAQMEPPPGRSVATGNRQLTCIQAVNFKAPRAPAAPSPLKHNREEQTELLSASQGSNTSSTAASEESESRSNPELDLSSDGDSDTNSGISTSQAATHLKDRLQAVRAFILSDSELYTQILQYQPLVLSQLQERLKAAGIRLGAAKLVDYLDSQCITFTTAKLGHSAPSRRRVKTTKAVGQSGLGRKRGGTATH